MIHLLKKPNSSCGKTTRTASYRPMRSRFTINDSIKSSTGHLMNILMRPTLRRIRNATEKRMARLKLSLVNSRQTSKLGCFLTSSSLSNISAILSNELMISSGNATSSQKQRKERQCLRTTSFEVTPSTLIKLSSMITRSKKQ